MTCMFAVMAGNGFEDEEKYWTFVSNELGAIATNLSEYIRNFASGRGFLIALLLYVTLLM